MTILILFLLILLNGVFAMSEMALVSARKARLQKLIDEGDHGSIAAAKLAEDPANFMSTMQIGISTITILSGILGEAALADPVSEFLISLGVRESISHTLAIVLVVAIITYVNIVVGELAPKRLGQIAPEKISRIVSRPVLWLTMLMMPIVHFLSGSTYLVLRSIGIKNTKGPTMTSEEIHAILVEGSQSGLIDENEHQMVRNVFRLDDRKIASLMVPRLDVTWLSVDDSIEKILEIIERSEFSRFPVCRESVNDVMGVVMAKSVLTQALQGKEINLEALMQPPLYVPESLNGMELLTLLRSSQTEMALVVDEYGDIQGIVTVQDLIEAITGEFQTDDEEDSYAIQREDGSWLLDGLIPSHDLKDRLQIKVLPQEERGLYNTLSGLIMMQLGRIPKTADKIEWAGWLLEIIDMDGKRIDKVLATYIADNGEVDEQD
jgi:putative hemolysin